MWRFNHSDRRHRLLGLVFYALIFAGLMVFVLDGAGYRQLVRAMPASERPYEVIELKTKKPTQPSRKTSARPSVRQGQSSPPANAGKAHTTKQPSAAQSSATTSAKRVPAPTRAADSVVIKSADDSPAAVIANTDRQTSIKPGAHSRADIANKPDSKTATTAGKASPGTGAAKSASEQAIRQAPATTRPVPAATQAELNRPERDGWVVQVASYADQANALGMQKKLRTQFDSVYIEPAEIKGERRYRVRIGPLVDEEQAEKTQRQLKAFGIIRALIDAPSKPADRQRE